MERPDLSPPKKKVVFLGIYKIILKYWNRVKRMVAENKGSSISVFINPNDVSRAHFRVGDKFT